MTLAGKIIVWMLLIIIVLGLILWETRRKWQNEVDTLERTYLILKSDCHTDKTSGTSPHKHQK